MLKALMVAGEEFGVDFEFTLNNAAASISGYVAKIQLRETSAAGKLIASWDDASPELTRNDAQGIVTLLIPADVTNTFNFKTAYMDLLLLKAPSGRRSAALHIDLDRGVTR